MWRAARHFLIAAVAFWVLSLGLLDSDLRFAMRLLALILAALFTFVGLIQAMADAPWRWRRHRQPGGHALMR